MRWTATCALVAAILCSPAIAGETTGDPACPRTENVIAVLTKLYPGTIMSRIEGADAKRFAIAFDNGTAATQWPADEILIARNPRTPDRAKIGFFKDGCLLAIVSRNQWSVDTLQRLLKSDQDV
jgi:hypothetical protein